MSMPFTRLTREHLPQLRPYLASCGVPSCDCSVGGVFLWRDYFKTEFAVENGALIFRFRYFGGVTAFSAPLGADISDACRLAESESGGRPFFCAVTPEQAERISECFNGRSIKTVCVRDWYDYLYDPSAFISFSGKKFAAKRNHINKFAMLYPNASVRPLTASLVPELKSFLASLPANEPSELSSAEDAALFEMLNHYDEYGFCGLLLYVGDRIVAFSAGDVLGNTLFVHFEKADTSFEGSYTVIAHEFAKAYAENVSLINREEDMGLDGLRRSKLSYNPKTLLEKQNIIIE